MDAKDRRPFMLVVPTSRRIHTAVLRAAALALLAQKELRLVVCCTPTSPASSDAGSTSVRETLRWLGTLVPDSPVEVRIGSPLAVAAALGNERRARAIVIAAEDVERPDRVASIASETGTPILVARRWGGRAALLAATDLEDADADEGAERVFDLGAQREPNGKHAVASRSERAHRRCILDLGYDARRNW
jgi:hypothetical protein